LVWRSVAKIQTEGGGKERELKTGKTNSVKKKKKILRGKGILETEHGIKTSIPLGPVGKRGGERVPSKSLWRARGGGTLRWSQYLPARNFLSEGGRGGEASKYT